MSVDLEIIGMMPKMAWTKADQLWAVAALERSSVTSFKIYNLQIAHFKNEDYIYDEKIMRNPGM